MRNRQRGLSVISTLLTVAVLGVILLSLFKLIPVYSEYTEIKNILVELAKDPHQTEQEVRSHYQLKASVAGVTSVKPADLFVAAGGNYLTVRAKYRREVPLVANVSLVFDFDTSAGETPASQSQ